MKILGFIQVLLTILLIVILFTEPALVLLILPLLLFIYVMQWVCKQKINVTLTRKDK